MMRHYRKYTETIKKSESLCFNMRCFNQLMQYLYFKKLFFMASQGSSSESLASTVLLPEEDTITVINNTDGRGTKRAHCMNLNCTCDCYERPIILDISSTCSFCQCPAAKHAKEDEPLESIINNSFDQLLNTTLLDDCQGEKRSFTTVPLQIRMILSF